MRQGHGQPLWTFSARIKGKAQVFSFTKQFSNVDCWWMVGYTDGILKYVLISGISDEDIKKDVLEYDDLDNQPLNETISVIENKEMAARTMSTYSSSTAVYSKPYKYFYF